MMIGKHRRYTLEEQQRALELFEAGDSVFEASAKLGRTVQGLAELCRRRFMSNRWLIDINRKTPAQKTAAALLRRERLERLERERLDTQPARGIEYDLIAHVKVTDTFQNCVASMRTISFYGSLEDVEPPKAPKGYRHVTRSHERRLDFGGGVSKWIAA